MEQQKNFFEYIQGRKLQEILNELSQLKSLDFENEEGQSPLIVAIDKKFDTIADLLLSCGANPNHKDHKGRTPIMYASFHSMFDLVKTITTCGGRIDDADNDGHTVMHYALWGKTKTVSEFLLDIGADPRVKGEDGLTPLQLAIDSKNKNLVEMLLKRSVDLATELKDPEEAPRLLVHAIATGNIEIVKLLNEFGLDINMKDEKERSALHYAASLEQKEIVDFLLENGSEEIVNWPDSNGVTPLMITALLGNELIVEELMEHGADPNAKDKNLQSPLILASALMNNSVFTQEVLPAQTISDILTLDLQSEIDSDMPLDSQVEIEEINLIKGVTNKIRNNQITRISGAHQAKNLDVIKIHGGTFDSANNDKIVIKGKRGHTKVVKKLIERGSEVNWASDNKQTALLRATQAGNASIAKVLMDHGANTELANDEGKTALDLANESQDEMMIKVLMNEEIEWEEDDLMVTALADTHSGEDFEDEDEKADPNDRDRAQAMLLEAEARQKQNEAYQKAAEEQRKEALEKERQKRFHAALNKKNARGQTPLMIAAAQNAESTVINLLEKGAEIDLKDFQGYSALSHAVNHGHANIVDILCKKGASTVERSAKVYAPMTIAVLKGLVPVVKILLENKASPNEKVKGMTLLMMAAKRGDLAMVETLIAGRADVHHKDFKGKTALNYAKDNGHKVVFEFIKKNLMRKA